MRGRITSWTLVHAQLVQAHTSETPRTNQVLRSGRASPYLCTQGKRRDVSLEDGEGRLSPYELVISFADTVKRHFAEDEIDTDKAEFYISVICQVFKCS